MHSPETDTHVAVSRLFVGTERTQVLPGETLCADDLPGGVLDIANYLKGGSIRELTAPVQRTAPPAVPADPAGDDLTTKGGKVARPTVQEIDRAQRSKFAIDPDGIRALTLDQLNVMVQERDASIAPFETEEEAVACLSADYIAPATETSTTTRRPA